MKKNILMAVVMISALGSAAQALTASDFIKESGLQLRAEVSIDANKPDQIVIGNPVFAADNIRAKDRLPIQMSPESAKALCAELDAKGGVLAMDYNRDLVSLESISFDTASSQWTRSGFETSGRFLTSVVCKK